MSAAAREVYSVGGVEGEGGEFDKNIARVWSLRFKFWDTGMEEKPRWERRSTTDDEVLRHAVEDFTRRFSAQLGPFHGTIA